MAKEILAVLVFISIVVSIACQEYVSGSPVRRFQGRSAVVTNFDCQNSPSLTACATCRAKFGSKFGLTCSDCQTTLLCFGKPLMAQPCAMLDPSKPYCRDSDGECVSEVPRTSGAVRITGATGTAEAAGGAAAAVAGGTAGAAVGAGLVGPAGPVEITETAQGATEAQSTSCILKTTTAFKCTGEGQFPDPDDCTKYYYCEAAGDDEATPYDCPSGYVYDSKTGLCKQKKNAADCKTISCQNRSNQYQIFAADKSILALCLQSGETNETILFRCPDPVSMEYDERSLKCEFICKTEGRFPIQGKTSKYFECYRNGKVLASRIRDCSKNLNFNKDLKICKK